MTNWIYRAEITDHLGTVRRYATTSYTTTTAHPTIPNTFVDGRLQQPLLFRRDMYGQDRTYGDVDIGHGEAVISNADGALDSIRTLGFDGRKFELYRVDPANLDADDRLEFRGVMEEIIFDLNEARVYVRDMSYVFDRPLQATTYAGNNSLPNGLEGTASDLKGKPKPRAYGDNYNISPPCVNTSRLIYQLTDEALVASYTITVYDKRVALTAGLERVLADFQAGATSATVSSIDTATDIITFTGSHGFSTADPVHVAATTTLPGGLLDTQYYYARSTAVDKITLHPTTADANANTNIVDITSAGSGTITVARNRTPYGRYDWCSDAAGSYIRTGSQATRLTVDLMNGLSVDTTADDVLAAVLARAATDYADISAYSFSLVNRIAATFDPVIGVYFDSDLTIYEALREIVRSIGGSFHVFPDTSTLTSKLIVTRLTPGGTTGGTGPKLSDEANTILMNTLRRVQPSDTERSIPSWRVNAHYKRNRTVMSASDLAGAAASEIAFAELEYRTVKVDTTAYQTVFPASPQLDVHTSLTVEADASTFASYIAAIKDLESQMFTVSCPIEIYADFLALSPGVYGVLLGETTLNLAYPRFGMDGGMQFAATGYTLDYEAQTVEFTLWGPADSP